MYWCGTEGLPVGCELVVGLCFFLSVSLVFVIGASRDWLALPLATLDATAYEYLLCSALGAVSRHRGGGGIRQRSCAGGAKNLDFRKGSYIHSSRVLEATNFTCAARGRAAMTPFPHLSCTSFDPLMRCAPIETAIIDLLTRVGWR